MSSDERPPAGSTPGAKPNPDGYTWDYDKTLDSSRLHYVKPYPSIEKGEAAVFPELVLGDALLIENALITNRTPFQPQDRMAFSPLPSNAMSLEGLALLGIIFSFARSKEGSKSLERIIIKYLDSCARIIESVQDACHSNWLTALNNQMITVTVNHRIGLMDDAGYLKVMSHYTSVFDKMLQVSVFSETFSGITTLVQGSKTSYTGEAGKGETAESATAGGIPALTAILTKALAAGAV